jgi:alkylation response protein AidB-like acyl-CoA dehydrogenase
VQAALADAEATLRSARLYFHETLAATWRRTVAGPPPTLEERADLLLAGTHAARSAVRAVDLMHGVAGTTGVYASSRLERHFRDAHTVRHHGFVSEGRLETVGQVYLGVAPEFDLVGL